MSAEFRANILDEAKGYVTRDRNTSYGEPEDNFKAIAEMWNAQGVSIDGRPVDATDVALMMAGMKLARLRTNPYHRDSWVDGIGYLACGGDVASSAQQSAEQIRAEEGMPVIKEGPFKGWREAGFTNDPGWLVPDMAGVDPRHVPHLRGMPDINQELADDLADVASFRLPDVTPRNLMAAFNSPEPRVSPVKVDINDMGWVSDNRCGNANPHEAHPYCTQPSCQGTGHRCNAYWCDGWVANHRAKQEADLETVKRVAAKHSLDSQRACNGKEPHHDCEPAC